jgi:hypothetical protein
MRDPSEVTSESSPVCVHIAGDVRGAVAGANYGLQIGSNSGVVLNVLPSAERPIVQPKVGPIASRGRTFVTQDLLDRAAETRAAIDALQAQRPVAFFGPPGIGKTTMLRYLAWREDPGTNGAGILKYRLRQQPAETVDDLLQYVFDQFFDTGLLFKLVRNEASRQYLEQLNALILLDDVALSDDDVRELLDGLPNCQLVVASTQTRLSRQDAQPISLQALPLDAALTLLERELGRALTAAEIPTATEICRALAGRAGEIVELARLIEAEGEEGQTLDVWLAQVQSRQSESDLTRQLLARLQEPERRVLSTLVALAGASVRAEHIAPIADVRHVAPALATLVHCQLAEADALGYRATDSALAALPTGVGASPIVQAAMDDASVPQLWDVASWAKRAIDHFTAAVDDQRREPAIRPSDLDAVMRALSRASELRQWRAILHLGRAIEQLSITSRRWGTWQQLLEWMLQAARLLGDRPTEAYVLHELGSRALATGSADSARSLLDEALRLRRALGDRDGESVTRHNLALLRSPFPWILVVLGTVLTIVTLSGGIVLARGQPPPPPPMTTMPIISTHSPTPTLTPTPSATPTLTPTGTATATPTASMTPTLTATCTATAIATTTIATLIQPIAAECTAPPQLTTPSMTLRPEPYVVISATPTAVVAPSVTTTRATG